MVAAPPLGTTFAWVRAVLDCISRECLPLPPLQEMLKKTMTLAAGMSGPQMLLVGSATAGYVQWKYSSAAKLQDHMETQVYVRTPYRCAAVGTEVRADAACNRRATL